MRPCGGCRRSLRIWNMLMKVPWSEGLVTGAWLCCRCVCIVFSSKGQRLENLVNQHMFLCDSESRHDVQCCCFISWKHRTSVNVFSHWTETQHRVSLLLYNKEEIKRVWLKWWLESFIYYTLLRILWQSIHMYRVQTWWRSAELSCVH